MKKVSIILLILVTLDLMFIGLHILYSFDYLHDKDFKTSQDGGYGEFYQYLKFIGSGLILLLLATLNRSLVLFFWSTLAFFLFLDDWLRIHENVGGDIFGDQLESVTQGAYHVGQVVYGVLVALVICALGKYLKIQREFLTKKLSLWLFLSISMLWISAVGIDYLHAVWIPRNYNLQAVLLEEGGEHLAASLFFWFCIREIFSQGYNRFTHLRVSS